MAYVFYGLLLTWFGYMVVHSPIYWQVYYGIESWWWGVFKLFNL